MDNDVTPQAVLVLQTAGSSPGLLGPEKPSDPWNEFGRASTTGSLTCTAASTSHPRRNARTVDLRYARHPHHRARSGSTPACALPRASCPRQNPWPVTDVLIQLRRRCPMHRRHHRLRALQSVGKVWAKRDAARNLRAAIPVERRDRDPSEVDATAGVEPATRPGMSRCPGPPGSPR